MAKNYYLILQVEPQVEQQAIEAAYRRLALLYHPDLNQSSDANLRMQEINEAYAILRKPESRALYDHEQKTSCTLRSPIKSHPNPVSRTWKSYVPPPPPTPPPAVWKEKASEEQVILFYLEHSAYGLSLTEVISVLMMQPITPNPMAPSFSEGTIHIRGHEIPVIDMRKHLGLPEQPVTRQSRIVLAQLNGLQLGLIVDSIETYLNIPLEDIEISLGLPSVDGVPFIRGVARNGFQLIVLLNLAGLFSSEEIDSLQPFRV